MELRATARLPGKREPGGHPSLHKEAQTEQVICQNGGGAKTWLGPGPRGGRPAEALCSGVAQSTAPSSHVCRKGQGGSPVRSPPALPHPLPAAPAAWATPARGAGIPGLQQASLRRQADTIRVQMSLLHTNTSNHNKPTNHYAPLKHSFPISHAQPSARTAAAL